MKINNVDTLFDETLKQSKLSAKQQTVLRVSLNLFAEQGFDRTGTSEIAVKAGVSEGTVFKHFKTKAGILNALLSPFVDHVVPKAAFEFKSEIEQQEFSNPETFFKYIIKDRLIFAINNQKQLKIFVQEIIRHNDVAQTFLEKIRIMVMDVFNNRLQQFKDKGQVINWPTEKIIQYFFSLMGGYVIPSVLLDQTDQLNVEEVSTEVANFLMRGLSPKPNTVDYPK